MSILQRIALAWQVAKRDFNPGEIPSRDPALAALFGWHPTVAGVSVTEDRALTYSAVWAAVQIIASSVAALPLKLFRRREDGGKEEVPEHRLYRIIHDEPNPEMSSMTMREMMQAHLLTWGNAYAEIRRDASGRVIELWPITPRRVSVVRNSAGLIEYRLDNGVLRLPAEDVFHVRGLGYDGLVGYSPIRYARESLGLGLATEQYGASFFGNGAWAGMVLKHPGRLTKESKERLTASYSAFHQGSEKAHRTLVLEEGMTPDKLTIPPDDAQFLETREFQVEEVARWFNIQPHKIKHLERSTNNNIEHQGIEFVTDTILPWCVRWEQEINRKLISVEQRGQLFAKHNVAGLMRGDAKTQAEVAAIGRQWGWFSSNDVLRMMDQNPIGKKGDIYLVPVNMIPAEKAGEMTAPQVKEDDQGPSDRVRAMVASRDVVADVLGRLVRYEAASARRAARHGPTRFASWVEKFYAGYADKMRIALAPAIRAHLALVNCEDSAPEVIRRGVDEHVQRSSDELLAAPANRLEGAVEEIVGRWEISRPSEMADMLFRDTLPGCPRRVDAWTASAAGEVVSHDEEV